VKKYVVYQRTDTGVDIIAQIDENGNFSGRAAEVVRELLIQRGYPEISPPDIIHGGYSLAAEDDD
jgi:hypothetical protein